MSSFGEDVEGGVSLPKFLCFLGKEYGRSGVGGTASSTGLAGRLRLILKKVLEEYILRIGCTNRNGDHRFTPRMKGLW